MAGFGVNLVKKIARVFWAGCRSVWRVGGLLECENAVKAREGIRERERERAEARLLRLCVLAYPSLRRRPPSRGSTCCMPDTGSDAGFSGS